MAAPGDPFSGKLRAVNSNPHDPVADLPNAPDTPEADTGPIREVGGREGPEPTRYGDWELRGRCIDF
jgi:hypothetical protein